MYLLEYILYRVKGHLVNKGIITSDKTLQLIEDIEWYHFLLLPTIVEIEIQKKVSTSNRSYMSRYDIYVGLPIALNMVKCIIIFQ